MTKDEDEDMGEERSTGPWTDEERVRFVEGMEQFGKDFQSIATFIGTRDISQVRNYFRAHMVRTHGKDWKSQESSRKRKSMNDDSSVDVKKPKNSNKKSSPPRKSTTSTVITTSNSSTKSKTIAPERKASPVKYIAMPYEGPSNVENKGKNLKTERKISLEKSSAMPSQGHDILPPVKVPSNVATDIVMKPEKTAPVVKVSSALDIEEEFSTDISRKDRIFALLRREEVQSVISGFVGFFTVIAIKKVMG